MIKVTFIGAGSIEFTRNVVTDLCGFPEISGGLQLALYDISAERLAHAELLANRIAAQAGAGAFVTATPDRREALRDANYVINEVQVGGYDATRLDFDIPARYGLRQTIADTIGIGGIFRGLRTIPVVLELARDMAAVCPDAYLLSYSNPMAMLPWAVYEGTDFNRVYGLCHSVRDTQQFLAGLVGADQDQVRFLTAGFNHQAFVLRFEQDGHSLYPKLREVIDSSPELQRRVRVEIFRRFGYFPTESSEHSAEYVPWFMRHDSQLAQFRIPVGEYLTRSEANLRELEELQRALRSEAPLDLTPTHELASLFIHSLETGRERELHVNIRNGGLISSLPPECCVEVPCAVGAGGPKPVPVGALPPQLAALNRTFLNVAELTVRAALDGNRDHVYQAALLDPNAAATLTTTQIVALCDELLAAHRQFLPAGLQ
ncbi:MAG: alpha-glucosidase/alpha-galactosidase [Actinobacteria bacterium]|nr:alpha-glucosidase/alpha-galactosidase [Actinomycetota bacterium]MBO0817789.1 alpha-glucosidase/alpha-galactosidase [Actinomycetota bacterium]